MTLATRVRQKQGWRGRRQTPGWRQAGRLQAAGWQQAGAAAWPSLPCQPASPLTHSHSQSVSQGEPLSLPEAPPRPSGAFIRASLKVVMAPKHCNVLPDRCDPGRQTASCHSCVGLHHTHPTPTDPHRGLPFTLSSCCSSGEGQNITKTGGVEIWSGKVSVCVCVWSWWGLVVAGCSVCLEQLAKQDIWRG